MTQEQKAHDLVESFSMSISPLVGIEIGKMLATMAVDEIIKDYQNSISTLPEYKHAYDGGLWWWQRVKEEIELIK